jgi:general secretion pathway protein D
MNQSMQLVVDERANSLIFNTTGDQYRQLLPLIKRLDVMPKQVILEVMIAEVKLTDSFQRGVDFVLTNQGTATKSGGFTLESNQTGLQYILTGTKGNITVNLLETNDNVNVLSRPSLLVRDGVTASITIGDDVPTVGEIVSDPVNGSRSSVNYRKTGVELKVKPTINARGTIIMEIDQKISDQADSNESVGGSPIFFERSINTEVVAQSGQTIVLGGLISNKKTVNERNVPFFSSIPLIGGLFEGTSNSKVKTELVVLVTPRIIESSDEWQEIKAKFSSTLSEITIEQ